MNKIRFSSIACLTAALAMIVFSSCNKNEITETTNNTTQENSLISLPSNDINLDLEVRNGRLVFEDLTHLKNTLTYLSANEKRFFTNEALTNWETSIGFKSARQEFEEATDLLDEVETLAEFENFKEEFSDVVLFDADNVPNGKIPGILSFITEGQFCSYIMGNEIHVYKGNLTIAMPLELEDRLSEIYENPQTNEDLGIFVINSSFDDSSNAQLRACDGASNLFCDDEEGKKKVTGQYLLQILYGNLRPGNVRNFTFQYKTTARSLKKKLWWWGKNHDDDLQFGTGWGAQWDMPSIGTLNPCTNFTHNEVCHGTGWTQNSWEITSTFILESEWTAPAWGPCHLPDNREFLYNINFVQNNDVSNLTCENSCFTRTCR